jgi:linoleoyl-CoA desaturase
MEIIFIKEFTPFFLDCKTKTMSFKALKFNTEHDADFSKTLKQNVASYFKENNISKYANVNMVMKTIFMISLYCTPYLFMVFGFIENPLLIVGMWILMAFGMSGIGLSIMHDANHGSYSRNHKWNTTLGYLLNFVGGNVSNWKVQHNVLHHTFTNIEGSDGDIDGGSILRFSPHDKKRSFHKAQHIYAWFLYSLMTLSWATVKEFTELKSFNDRGLIKPDGKIKKMFFQLVSWKILYFGYSLVIPMIFIPISSWFVLCCWIGMHMISGLILSSIFQSAHVVDTSEFPVPNEAGKMEQNFMVHQLHNTANFAQKKPLFSWFIGGLNFQIEHHLFPDICHIHYKNISKIVRETAEDYGIPYHSFPTFRKALLEHGKMLKKLGN